jgi:hypothetical protein
MTLVEDIRELQEQLKVVQKQLEEHSRRLDRQGEQIGGERGLSAALNDLTQEVKSLRETFFGEIKTVRKAAYWVAGLIVASSIGFAFSVLALIP